MTIKTQGGKVLTKNGKVSCECCEGPGPEPECCMYSAAEFVSEFIDNNDLFDDLPQSLIAIVPNPNDEDQFITVSLTKTNPTPPRFDYYVGGDVGIHTAGGSSWGMTIYDPIMTEWYSSCLIGNYDQGVAIVEDQFADTYTVSGPISGTVTRESICVWTGANLRLTNFSFQWKINSNNKSGFQNTPVGSYAGGFTVS